MGDLISIADLRQITGQPNHVIKYAIERHGPLPIGRIGVSRVWRREDLAAIQESLAKTAQRSVSRHPTEVAGS